MKNALGITRNIDALGRVVLPKEIRIALGHEVGTPLEMISDKGGVYIRKQSVGCTFCQSMDEVVAWHGALVCKVCARRIAEKDVKEGACE